MTDRSSGHRSASMTLDTHTPFKFRVIHGADPTKKSSELKAVTRTLSLDGLIFETATIKVEDFHLSFTETSFGRNFLEITLELGKKLPLIQVIGQVEWYENRPGPRSNQFIVGVSFVDIQADAVAILRQYLKMSSGLAR